MVSEQTQKFFHPNNFVELTVHFFALFVIKLVSFLNAKNISINITILDVFINNVDIRPYFLFVEERALYMMVRFQTDSR